MKKIALLSLASLLVWGACTTKSSSPSFRLEQVLPEYSGIDFRNDLHYTEQNNPYTFRNFYNGAGVALGDINQDGLLDIFLAGNQTSNRLYLNKGNFQFEDITDAAGLNSTGSWTTGVSMVDINGDGLLDIYVCKSGPLEGPKRKNELFINQGSNQFLEQASAYGLDVKALSQHAVFFDFDKDGDLDLYLLSNSARSVGVYDLREGQREIRDPEGGNRLYRNDGDFFTDVSEEAGIYGSAIGYGLGVTVADLNEDHWPDLYVSNDFFERDYLYLNNQDGTFTEILPELLPEISLGSMGADIADLNNDGRVDIFVTEMLPEDLNRVKTKTPFESWDKHQSNLLTGYHRQFTRNTLQQNLGQDPQTGLPLFAEIARMAGVHATDWSWGALIFDADLDGKKDIFVANGIVKDLTDFDFVDFYATHQDRVEGYRSDSSLITRMIDAFPSNPLTNYWYKNEGNWHFTNQADQIGLDAKTFSTGAAYGDLDNDGDLDLVINNLNGPVGLYRNNARDINLGNYLTLDLGGEFGAQVLLHSKQGQQYLEYQPVKGYMSSVDPRLFFGLGEEKLIQKLEIRWPNETRTILENVEVNQSLRIRPDQAEPIPSPLLPPPPLLGLSTIQPPLIHQESPFVDFDQDRLRFWSISNEGPKGSFLPGNHPGESLLFLPGAKNHPSQLLRLSDQDSWQFLQPTLFQKDSLSEDVASLFFDANGDGLKDLLVLSGGIEFPLHHGSYHDRLYLQTSPGVFEKSAQKFHPSPTAFALSFDWDEDGDEDLIIGQRAQPFGYGIPVGIRFWENDGAGNFSDQTSGFSPQLQELGMLTDGVLADLDQQGKPELILAGEWMGIRVFSFQEGDWIDRTEEFGLNHTTGLWNKLLVEDLNEDGYPDILAGNTGTNTRLNFGEGLDLRMYVNDFDQNGSLDHIVCAYDGRTSTPWVMKNSLLAQLPYLKKTLLRYADYEDKQLEDLISSEILSKSVILEAKSLETSLWINQAGQGFQQSTLPRPVQQAPVLAIRSFEDKAGTKYLALGGNQGRIKPELGSQLGSYGWILKKNPDHSWSTLSPLESGFVIKGEIRGIETTYRNNTHYLLTFRNDDSPILFEILR